MTRLLIPLLLASLFGTAAAQAPNDELSRVKEQELEDVRRQISELKESMDRRASERDRITTELQDAEVTISEKRIALTEIQRRKTYSENRKAELERAIAEREAVLEVEMAQLGSQVRAAYTSGGQQRVKLLLNQQDPAALGRQLKYYEYLSRYRAANIEVVNENLAELSTLRADVATEAASLARLASSREDELAELTSAQNRRRELLASLNARLSTEGEVIDRLAEQEKDLARLIAELASILSDYPITSEEPFTALKGELTWPVAGQLLHDYGEARGAGQITWNGVVVTAPRGREVRAVYHGRVVFADWLAGMGLLVIVDHGEGYLTLYGYNETLLKSPGDWVAPGDVIATVGDSGGQPQSGLYFEVRRGSTPVNPKAWVTRQPKAG